MLLQGVTQCVREIVINVSERVLPPSVSPGQSILRWKNRGVGFFRRVMERRMAENTEGDATRLEVHFFLPFSLKF